MTEHIEPGFYRKSHQDYHAGPGLSQSMIKALLRSPAHAKVPVEETPAMRFGRAFHTGRGEEARPIPKQLSSKRQRGQILRLISAQVITRKRGRGRAKTVTLFL
jgi:hypothetical protein